MAVEGRLSEMGLPTLVQLNCQEGKRTQLTVQRNDGQAILYFAEGDLVHAILRPGEGVDSLEGEGVVYQIIGWEDGTFSLEAGVDPPAHTIHTPWAALLMEGLQRHDEERWDTLEDEEMIRRNTMSARTTTDILRDFLAVPGISTAVVVGRDGFVIEAGGDTRAMNLDALGASLAHAINGIEMMGKELEIRSYRDLFVEYEGALILSRPVGDAIIALVAADASQLGIVRYQIKPLVQELERFF